MSDLPEFQRGMIVGARLYGATVRKQQTFWGLQVVRYQPLRQRTQKRVKRRLAESQNLLIVARKHKQSLFDITSEMNSHLRDPVSTKTDKKKLHAANIYGKGQFVNPWLQQLMPSSDADGDKFTKASPDSSGNR